MSQPTIYSQFYNCRSTLSILALGEVTEEFLPEQIRFEIFYGQEVKDL